MMRKLGESSKDKKDNTFQQNFITGLLFEGEHMLKAYSSMKPIIGWLEVNLPKQFYLMEKK